MGAEPPEVTGSTKPDGFGIIESDIIALIKECSFLKAQIRRKDEASKKEMAKILLSLLEVVDSFDRVFKNIESKAAIIDKQTKIWLGNFKSVRRLLEKVLKDSGVTVIEALNGKAVPGFHYIVETQQVEGLEDDIIIEEKQKGYLWLGEILRKSEVITVKN